MRLERAGALCASAYLVGCGAAPFDAAWADHWATAFAAEDAEQVGRLYANGAVVQMPEGGPPRAGRADVQGYYRALWDAAEGGLGRPRPTSKIRQADERVTTETHWHFPGTRAFGAVSTETFTEGPSGEWQITRQTWTTVGQDHKGSVGARCTRDEDCKALGLCDDAGVCNPRRHAPAGHPVDQLTLPPVRSR